MFSLKQFEELRKFVLFCNEKLFMFMRESFCWTRFESSNRSKCAVFFLDKILISAAFSTGNSGCPGIGCSDLSNHLIKSSALKVSLSKSDKPTMISA